MTKKEVARKRRLAANAAKILREENIQKAVAAVKTKTKTKRRRRCGCGRK